MCLSYWGQYDFMDPMSPIQSEMILFHDHAMILLIGIFSFVSFMLLKFMTNKFSSRMMLDAQGLEIIWTLVPAFLLIWLAMPSLRLLYLLDEEASNGLILKATGYQWYWGYQIPLKGNENILSYMIPEKLLEKGDYRLLEVSYRPKLPYMTNINVLTTSSDVIHSWALPSMGVKMDAVPGRLNNMGLFSYGPGIFYGQCSEICGAAHSFMPICIEFIKPEDF
uniref:Cytochrome c oxidase subunit 2 n=1 Tax=Achatinella fulgens TaxID=115939 RepID=A0A3S9AFL5_9EUPU|nr:cytochrome c oxidase subunit 2 [Achatinella fulgens]